MAQIRVVLADDHGLIRQGIRKLLEEDKNINVLDEVSNGEELLKKIRRGLRPGCGLNGHSDAENVWCGCNAEVIRSTTRGCRCLFNIHG